MLNELGDRGISTQINLNEQCEGKSVFELFSGDEILNLGCGIQFEKDSFKKPFMRTDEIKGSKSPE